MTPSYPAAQVRSKRGRFSILVLCLLLPVISRANPVLIDPVSGIAFLVVAFWAFVIEAGLVALLLMCSGLATARIFVAYFAANLIIFVLFFHPLLQRQSVPIALLEAAVVVLDAVAIKFLSNFDALQGDDYSHLTWRRAGVIAAVGNAASFFVGQIAAAAPWYMHSAPE